MDRQIRWGVLGTAGIAANSFLPGLREAGGGTAVAVAGRDASRAAAFAAENGVERGVAGYQRLLDDPGIDAVYIPLPNNLHAEWTIAALRAGKAVLCEKPLCLNTGDALKVVEAARESAGPLWEAFVFPFHPQTARLRELIEGGEIGELREVWSSFHFPMRTDVNIRLRPELGGGALYDVGCYPVRLGQLLFGGDPVEGVAHTTKGPTGVDVDSGGMVRFGTGRLQLSCGFRRSYDTFTRIVGTEGEIRVAAPWHPKPADVSEVWRDGHVVSRHEAGPGSAFSWAVRHIHEVLRGEAEPLHLAADDSVATARALDLLLA